MPRAAFSRRSTSPSPPSPATFVRQSRVALRHRSRLRRPPRGRAPLLHSRDATRPRESLIASREWGSLPRAGLGTSGFAATLVGCNDTRQGTSEVSRPEKRTISSHLPFLPFIVLSIWSFVALSRVFLLRLSYPLDLEWMEGGVLTHALRLGRGQPLYAEPSVDFVNFLYTPLYPAVLCVLSKVFGLSYILGRAVSILAFSGALVFLVAAVRGIAQQFESEELPAVATTAGLLGAAAVCLAFPFCGASTTWFAATRCGSFRFGGALQLLPGPIGEVSGAWGAPSGPWVLHEADSCAFHGGSRCLSGIHLGHQAWTGVLCCGLWLDHNGDPGRPVPDGWMAVDVHLSTPPEPRDSVRENLAETPRILFDYGFMLLVPIAGCLLRGLPAQAVREALLLGIHGGHGSCDGGRGRATQGAYDNAYIPAVYFGALLSAACAVELPRSRQASGPQRTGRSVHWRAPPTPARIAADLQPSWPGATFSHAMTRWLDPSPHVPTRQDHAKRGGSLPISPSRGRRSSCPATPSTASWQEEEGISISWG